MHDFRRTLSSAYAPHSEAKQSFASVILDFQRTYLKIVHTQYVYPIFPKDGNQLVLHMAASHSLPIRFTLG